MSKNELLNNAASTIKCKFVHQNELYIASNRTLWPCCFLWTHSIKYPDEFKSKMHYQKNWNNLKDRTIDEIINDDYFAKDLEKSWDPDHPQHFSVCITTCSFNQSGMNEISFEEKNDNK